ncbi:hypothetical protein F4779DRAFT_17028 [Xylariaceae sp. FL0662B]|nr:hypothetical protein F4779DRAFT_17028 [Xylariaceae sp. FL0662B]
MTEGPRQSAFMPTIKCSNCGNQVEISMMGDHVCGSAVPAAEPPPPMPDLLGGTLSSLKQNVLDKFTRAPPAVDTSAANRAFTKSDQLTPLSASTGSQAISPKTPNGRPGAGPTEDDYIPAIAGSPRRPGGYGGFGDRESYEPDSTYGTSPNKQPSTLLTRMNSIAPGPFEMNRRTGPVARSNSRDNTLDPTDDLLRPGTATSTSSNNSGGVAPPRAPRKNGYGGFGPPQKDADEFEPQPLGLGKRSETFPERLLTANNNDKLDTPARTPSAPGTRSDRLRSSSNITADRPMTANEQSQRPSFGIRDTSRPPPPRTNSIPPPTRDGNRKPSINLAVEFGASNPYHSPSVSQSSSNSGYSHMSQPSQASSSTSPARSMGSRTGAERRPSDNAAFDALMDDLQSSMDAMQPKGQPPSPGLKPPVDKSVQPLKSSNRRTPPEGLRLDPAIQQGQILPLGSPMKSPMKSPGSPAFPNRKDPAIQEGRSRSPPPRSHKRQPSRDPRSRGNCKACRQPITGKSISSADGRLTGRYHKACFVCTTCQEPFSSATFYVLNDKPYCEQHYHKLNGSLCGRCDRGIEGQYLEDEAPRKYHPGCFRCGDCGVVLRDGYFDVAGSAYCERDAWRRMQSAAAHAQHQHAPPNMPPGRMMPPPRGLPAGPGPLNRPFGLPMGYRLAPGQALGRGGLSPMPRMEKRRTRLGMM